MTRRSGFDSFIIVALILVLMGLVVYVGLNGITYRELIISFVAVAIVLAVALGIRGFRLAYILWIYLFVLGFRTILIGSYYRLHPLVVVAITIFVLWTFTYSTIRQKMPIDVPAIVWPMAFFWIWGLLMGLSNNIPFDKMLNQFVNFVAIIPIFAITYYYLQRPPDWRRVLLVFFVVATVIATMGIIEFIFPSVSSLLPGFIAQTSQIFDLSGTGFIRAPFAFFGAPTATFICLMAVTLVFPLVSWYRNLPARSMLILGCILNLIAIYVGGYRSIWLGTVIVFFAVAVIRRSFVLTFFTIIGFVLVYLLLPDSASGRFATLLSAVEGDFRDSSSLERSIRAEDAIQLITDNPLGGGWASSGLVHSDFLQFAADTSIFGGVLFVGWYIVTLFRLGQRCVKWRDPLHGGLFASFLAIGLLLGFEAIYDSSEIIIPAWFLWAVVHNFLKKDLSDPMRQDIVNQSIMSPNLTSFPINPTR